MAGFKKRSPRLAGIGSPLGLALFLAGYLAVFVALDHATLAFQTSSGVTPWYPPAGLSLAFLLILGPAFAPATFATVLSSGLWIRDVDFPLYLFALLALIITAGYSLAAFLLRRVLGIDRRLQSLRSVSWFVAVGLAMAGVVSALSAAVLTAAGVVPRSGYSTAGLNFWVGDAIGVMTVTPFLLSCVIPGIDRLLRRISPADPRRHESGWRLPSAGEALEMVGQALSVVLVLWVVFGSGLGQQVHLIYLCFLPLLWIAVRHGLPRAALGILVVNVGATIAASRSEFALHTMAELQALLLGLSLTGLFVGAVVAERQAMKQDIRALLNATTEAALLIDDGGEILVNNETLARRLGAEDEDTVGTSVYDWLPASVAEGRREKVERVIRSGAPLRFVDEWGDRIIDNSIYPVFDGRRDVVKLAIFGRDITRQRQAMDELQVSNRFLEIGSHHVKMEPMLNEIVAAVKDLTGCGAVGVRVLDKKGYIPYEAYEGFSREFYASEDPLSIDAHHCMCIDVVKGDTDPSLPFFTEGGSFYINGTSRFLATASEKEKGQTRNVCNEYGYESVALIPIRAGNRILGLIHVADHREDAMPLRTVRQLEGAAMHLGANLRRVKVREALRRRNRELMLFNRVGRALSSTLDLDEVLETLLEEVRSLLDITGCSVWLIDSATDELVCREAIGCRNGSVRGTRLAPGQGLAGWSAQHGENLIVADTYADDRHFKGVDQETGLNSRSVLTVPLESKEGVIGVLQAVDTAVDRFDSSDLRLLKPVAASAAMAIDNARLYAQAEEEITRRKQAERTLRESEQRFRLLYEDAPLGYQSLDADGNVLEVNQAWLELFGYSEKEAVVGRWFGAFIVPEQREDFRARFEDFKSRGEAHNVEYEAIRQDGSRRILSIDGNVGLDKGGEFKRSHCILHDITERKRLEEAYRTVVEHSLQGLAILRADGLVFANPAIAHLTGYSISALLAFSPDELKELIHVEDREWVWDALERKLAGREMSGRYDFRIIRRDGEMRWAEALSNRISYKGEPAVQVACLDITERKRAQEALRESEEKYRLLAEHSADVIYKMDIEKEEFTYVSPSVEVVFGYDPEEVVSRSPADLLTPESYREQRAAMQKELSKGIMSTETLQLDAVHRDGHIFPIEVHATLVPDENGKPVEILGVTRDISERKRAQEALRESEERFRTMADTAPVMLWVSDTDARCTFFNQPWLRFRGRTMEEEMGFGWTDGVHPEDLERCMDTYMSAFEARQDFRMEYRLKRSDGEYRWILDMGVPRFSPGGTFVGYIGSCVDITERKQAAEALRASEERFRTVFELAPIGITLVSPGGRPIRANRAFQEILGYSEEEFRNMVITDFTHTDDVRKSWQLIRDVVEGGRDTFTWDKRYRRKDGELVWGRVAVSSVEDSSGESRQLIAMLQDISDRKRTEETLRRRAKELDTLQATVLDITTRHELPALLETVVRRAARLLGASGGGLYLCDPDREEARCVVSYNAPRDYTDVVLSYGEGAAGVVAATGEPLIVDDYRTWSRRAPVYEEEQPFGAVLSAPMIWEGEVTGVIHVLHDEEVSSPFTQTDLELLNLFANHAAIAVENARLYDRLRSGRERLQALSQRIVDAQEVERRRIARELHDEIGQALTAVKIDLQAARSLLESTEHETQLEHTIAIVERTLKQVRDLSLDLRPSLLDDLGLVPALRWYVDRQAQQADLSAHFHADPVEKRLAPELEIACFRIVQEALTNVMRHARAEHVDVELLNRDGVIEMRIRDDGLGFDVQEALEEAHRGTSLGLLSMHERASVVRGEVEIESAPEVGTEVKARFPLAFATPEGM